MVRFEDKRFWVRIKSLNFSIIFDFETVNFCDYFFIEKAMIWRLFGLLKGLPHEADKFVLENMRHMTFWNRICMFRLDLASRREGNSSLE